MPKVTYRHPDGREDVVDVPVGLLVAGTNVVSAETHLNYRGTADVSFDLDATLYAQ